MATVEQTTLLTAEQFAQRTDLEHYELVRGEPVPMPHPGRIHGVIQLNIGFALKTFALPRHLGIVMVESGYVLERDPDTVRGPDVSFIRMERLVPEDKRVYTEGPPDLAVEVLSPDDRASKVNAKIDDYLKAGVVVVWLVDPETETVGVFRRDAAPLRLKRGEVLKCEELLPGLELTLDEIFRVI